METSKGTVFGVVAVAIAVIALGISVFGGNSGNQNVAGERAGLQEFIDGVKAGDLNTKWVSKTMAPATNSVKV